MTADKPFYTVNVAYTTPSGRMHMGHGLGMTLTDSILRYETLRSGKQPFFGFGIHSTGKDLVKIIRKLQDPEGLDNTLERYNISPEERQDILSQPDLDAQVDSLVENYKGQYLEGLEKLGIRINGDSFFSSHQPSNHRFTQWTLRKLQEKGLIVETESNRYVCSDCDDIKAIESDFSEVTPKGPYDLDRLFIDEGNLVFFEGAGYKVPVFTAEERVSDSARAVYDQGITYVLAENDSGEKFLIRKDRLDEFGDRLGSSLSVLSELKGSELEQTLLKNPQTGKEIAFLPSGEHQLTRVIGSYLEQSNGGPYTSIDELAEQGHAMDFATLEGGSFYCRLHDGTKIVIRKRNELAIDYGNAEMQQLTVRLAESMVLTPGIHAPDIEGIIRTRAAKPFERKPEETVGAASPFNPDKKVEALADSNIYMEFFAIAEYLNNGVLHEGNLNDGFFDYVFLREGDEAEVAATSGMDVELLREIRGRVENVYPVDLSVIGVEHKAVHLPFSLFTHAAVLPERFFFPEYLITSHITMNGEKMSKSKGNVIYLDTTLGMIEESHHVPGVSTEDSYDILRFFLAYFQSPDKNFDWHPDKFVTVGANKVIKFASAIERAIQNNKEEEQKEYGLLEKWLLTSQQRAIEDTTRSMDERNLRNAMINVVDLMSRELKQYLGSRPDVNADVVKGFVSSQLVMAYPVMPRIAERLHQNLLPDYDFSWPEADPSKIFPEEFEMVEYENLGKEGYIKSRMGGIMAEINRLKGRKELKAGDSITILVPAEHTAEVLSGADLKPLEQFSLDFKVDANVRVPVIATN